MSKTSKTSKKTIRPLTRIFAGVALAAGLTVGAAGTAHAWYSVEVMETSDAKKACSEGVEWYLHGMKVLRGGEWYICNDGKWDPVK